MPIFSPQTWKAKFDLLLEGSRSSTRENVTCTSHALLHWQAWFLKSKPNAQITLLPLFRDFFTCGYTINHYIFSQFYFACQCLSVTNLLHVSQTTIRGCACAVLCYCCYWHSQVWFSNGCSWSSIRGNDFTTNVVFQDLLFLSLNRTIYQATYWPKYF